MPAWPGILVCSFLGGMRAVTWTQVAQYVILIIAYMLPVVWLSVKHTGVPIPQAVYGFTLEKVTAKEEVLIKDPKELEVRGIFKARSEAAIEKLKDVPASMAADKAAAQKKLDDLKASNGSMADIKAAEAALAGLPKDETAAKAAYTAARVSNAAKSAPPIRHAEPFPGKDEAASDIVAQELPGAGVLPDDRHGSAAAHPDALLHRALGARKRVNR